MGELKEERSDHSGSWRIEAVHIAMSLVEQGVVVWQQRVADTKDSPADVSYRCPAIRLLKLTIFILLQWTFSITVTLYLRALAVIKW